MPVLLKQLARFSSLQDLKLHDAFVDETVFTSVCTNLQDLTSLNVSNNPALINVPPAISLLTRLSCLDVSNCESLLTFPDKLLHLKMLTDINARGCCNITYPPKTFTDQGRAKIFLYLEKAMNAAPLKRVKVMFLGNGRSGKTSLLRTLAKKPLSGPSDPGPPSTEGVSVDPYDDLLTPSWLDSKTNGGLPDMSFWDFAGQLEYSAAHDFFMSHRQAVYVIVFSVVEERESRMNQVAYWLRTVVAKGISEHVRFLLIGTKVDLIEGGLDSWAAIQRGIEVDMRSVVRSCCESVVMKDRFQILFVTSMSTHPHYGTMRRNVKRWIFASCRKIFEGSNLEMLRFPDEYKRVLESIYKLNKSQSWELPLLKLENLTDVKIYGEHLVNAHRNPAKLEALKVLHDVGAVIFCSIKEQGCDQPWICLKPQIIADVIAVFADPQSNLRLSGRACATRERLEEILVNKYLRSKVPSALLSSSKADALLKDGAQKLFGFLLAMGIFAPTEVSKAPPSENAPASATPTPEFIVPSALKGRPSFWREVFDSSAFEPEYLCLQGFRFTCMIRMITVAVFVKVMSSLCSDRNRMWGCAFSFDVKAKDDNCIIARIFVRLAEGRDFIDMIVVGSAVSLREKCVENALSSIASQLSCSHDINHRLYLCPHCCSSDMYVRSGAAHAFYHKQIHASKDPHHQAQPEPSVKRLSCSRYHEVAKESLRDGLCVGVLGVQGMPVLYPQASSTRDRLMWKKVSQLGIIELDDEPKQFKVMPNSFLELTQQLKDGELLSHACMQSIDHAIRSKATTCHFEPPLQRKGCDAPLAQLQLQFSVGSECGAGDSRKVIAAILSCSGTSEIESLAGNVVTTTSNHRLVSGSRVMLSAGFMICRVSLVFSETKLELRLIQEETTSPSDVESACSTTKKWASSQRITIFPMLDSFTFEDNVLVLYHVPQIEFQPALPLVDEHGRIHRRSFFALTKQLEAYNDDRTPYDVIVHPSKIASKLKSAVSPKVPPKIRVQFRVCEPSVALSLSSKAIERDRDLQLVYSIGDTIGGIRIEYIFSCSQKVEVECTSASGDITTARDHALSVGAKVLLSVPEDNGGKVQGVICKVSFVKSNKILTLTRDPPSGAQLPLALARGASIAPMLESFSVSDHVSVVLNQKPPFALFAGVTNDVFTLQLEPSDCSRSNEAACWREVEDNWAIMLGHEFQNYEITGMTLFRCDERERLFLEEVKQLEKIAPSRPAVPDFSCEKLDKSDKEKTERAELQQQIMGHFSDFSQKFGLLPVAENKDVNISVAWWGNRPSVYHGNAQNGFWNLPSHLKIDPGYYGKGFYLTRYPRYCDYYINGCRS
jgi:GTPase SAR1 family protein